MKANILLHFAAAVMLLATHLDATIWRVDNNGGAPGDFTTLQAAHNGSANGDTLYVYGSPINYGTLSLSKKLTVIGPGYFLSENPQTQANPAPATTGTIYFDTNSDSSMITGMQTGQIVISNRYGTAPNHITLKRNYIAANTNAGAVKIQSGANSITVQQCYIVNTYGNNSSKGIQLDGNNTSIIINNNFIELTILDGDAITAAATSVAVLSHNVIYGDFVISESQVINNIFRDGNFSGSSANVYLNNICSGTQIDTAGSNIQSVDMGTVFVASGSTDGLWQLAAGSPAISAGTEGVDIGMFGGGQPYVLSGVPTLPHIYYLTVPSAAEPGDPLQVRVKAKTGD